jgi:hypothetical protein
MGSTDNGLVKFFTLAIAFYLGLTNCSMRIKILPLFTLLMLFTGLSSSGQVVINEGSNRNYTSIADENGDFPDWIELYNSGNNDVNIQNYSLTDDPAEPEKWKFPDLVMKPHHYKVVFCSGKDKTPVSGFVIVTNTGYFTPVTGWNIHTLSTPFYWDGVSNLLINTCSFSSAGYTSNSVFKQVLLHGRQPGSLFLAIRIPFALSS